MLGKTFRCLKDNIEHGMFINRNEGFNLAPIVVVILLVA